MNDQDNVRVLIAEDDPLVCEMTRGLLEDAGHSVVGEAMDGLEAVEMTQSLRPDVVLMDIRMPDMDGLEAARLIYERCPTPVVVLTAYETEELVTKASAIGVGAYLAKPPNLREMERAIIIAMARFGDMMKLREYAAQLERRVQERTLDLQAKCARLEAILHSVSDGIIVTNEHGEAVQVNPVAQAWLTQTLSPKESARLQESVHELALQAEERPEAVLELTGLDLELVAAPLAKLGRDGATAVISIHDVSHLNALNRIMSRFISNMSHELRTPITTLKLNMALMRQKPPEEYPQFLDALEREVDWLARLARDIMQISRLDTGRQELDPRPTPLNDLIKVVIAGFETLAREKHLVLECCPETRWSDKQGGETLVSLVDSGQLTEALSNLLMNAMIYTSAGDRVVVSIGLKEMEERVWATVAVSDTGMGIPEKELPHIFERFFRGEKTQAMQISGTGLGLSIAKEIVELHGGWMTAESEVDVGTTVTVWLPLVEE
ncbi:MAG: response regulator [Chloroflexi bacterium]|nr:response regulator [Chloroflexota bacterium]